MSDATAIALAVFLLAANGFFVGAEFALISARRTNIEPLVAQGSKRARTTLHAMERVSLMMAGAQLGITVCSLGLGAVGEPAVAHLLERPFAAAGVPEALVHPIAFTIALAIVVFLHMVIGEMVPKNIAIAGPERSAMLLGPVLYGIVILLKPLIAGLNAVANGFLRLLKVEPKDEVASAFTCDEVAGLVHESRREGLLNEDEHVLITGALEFGDQPVERVLLPIDSLVTVPEHVTPAEVEVRCAQTGFSRFPVRDESGELTGYLHLKDVLVTDPTRRDEPIADKWVRPLPPVEPGDPLRAALKVMQARGAHLAQVVQRDGTVTGIVALEDLLEELVGEVRDATRAVRG